MFSLVLGVSCVLIKLSVCKGEYKYHRANGSGILFDDAESECKSSYPGSHLVSIHNKSQNDYLGQHFFETGMANEFWIGLYGKYDYKNSPDTHVNWTDGSTFDYWDQ